MPGSRSIVATRAGKRCSNGHNKRSDHRVVVEAVSARVRKCSDPPAAVAAVAAVALAVVAEAVARAAAVAADAGVNSERRHESQTI